MAKIYVARVLHEDEEMVTIEFTKVDDRPLQVRDGDRFLSLVFVKSDGAGGATDWDPFPKED